MARPRRTHGRAPTRFQTVDDEIRAPTSAPPLRALLARLTIGEADWSAAGRNGEA